MLTTFHFEKLKRVKMKIILQKVIQPTVVCKKVHKIGLYGVKWPYEK